MFMTIIYPMFIPPKQKIIIHPQLDENDPNRERMIIRHEVNERLTKITEYIMKKLKINSNNKYIKSMKHALKKINSGYVRFKYWINVAIEKLSIYAQKVTGVEWYHLVYAYILKKKNKTRRLLFKEKRKVEKEEDQNKNQVSKNSINSMLSNFFKKTNDNYKSTIDPSITPKTRKRSSSLLETYQKKIAKTLPLIQSKISKLVKPTTIPKKEPVQSIIRPETNIIERVPDELMIHIFTYYGEYHQVASDLIMVCQQFKDVIDHPYLLTYYHTKIPSSFLEHYKLHFEDDDRKNQKPYMLYFWANHSFDYIHHLQLEQQNRKQAYQQQVNFLRRQQQDGEGIAPIKQFDGHRECNIIGDHTIAARWMVKLNGLWKGHIFLAGEEQPYLKCQIDPAIVGNHSFLNDMVLVEGTVNSVTWASESSNFTEITLNISRISGDNYTWFHAFQYLIAATGLTILMVIVAFVICAIGQMVTLGAIIFYAGKFCMYLTLCLYHLSLHVYEKKRREYVYLTDSIDSTDPFTSL